MSGLEELKQTFFDECSELIQNTEAGLTEMREGVGTSETINAVFRAVHSVKGGAGIFGFNSLVEFAHVFETVLDALRRGALTPTPETVDVLLCASDVLTDLIQMSRAGDPIPPTFGEESRAALQALMESGPASGGDEAEEDIPDDGNIEGLDFTPVRADAFDDDDPAEGTRCYEIVFRPKPEMLKKANEPLYILRELHRIGELDLVADISALPPLAELDAERPYIGWTGTLRTSAERAQIEEVFEFVVGDCELSIEERVEPAMVAVELMPAPPLAPDDQAPVSAMQAPAAPPPAVAAAETAERSAEARPSGSKAAATTTTTRIELERIDRVVNMVGELVIAQAMLGQIVHDLPETVRDRLSQILEEVVHHTRELKDSVMSMRAQPVGNVFQRMPRLVRELSAKTGKKVRLEMAGETTEVDRSIIERLGDPLTHIIRNAVDHGIEAPAERLAAGKADEGTIRLSAEHRGGRIVIEVSDDGGGINSERVLKKAREQGLVSADATFTEDEMNNLIFLPGFSTAEAVSDISGRGVGMDVVRRNIQDIGGRITLKSVRHRGMTIQLALPLTLAVMDGMVIKVGQETYVMPLATIIECLRPSSSDVHDLIGTRGMLHLRGELVPLVYLGDVLDVASTQDISDERVVIITDGGEGARFGLIVDELCGHQQVVIKGIEESYGSVPGLAAATILGNGRVAFILDVEKLSDLAVNSWSSSVAGANGRLHAGMPHQRAAAANASLREFS